MLSAHATMQKFRQNECRGPSCRATVNSSFQCHLLASMRMSHHTHQIRFLNRVAILEFVGPLVGLLVRIHMTDCFDL